MNDQEENQVENKVDHPLVSDFIQNGPKNRLTEAKPQSPSLEIGTTAPADMNVPSTSKATQNQAGNNNVLGFDFDFDFEGSSSNIRSGNFVTGEMDSMLIEFFSKHVQYNTSTESYQKVPSSTVDFDFDWASIGYGETLNTAAQPSENKIPTEKVVVPPLEKEPKKQQKETMSGIPSMPKIVEVLSVNQILENLQMPKTEKEEVFPLKKLAEEPQTEKIVEVAPIPKLVEVAPIPKLVEDPPIPKLVEVSPIPELVEDPQISKLADKEKDSSESISPADFDFDTELIMPIMEDIPPVTGESIVKDLDELLKSPVKEEQPLEAEEPTKTQSTQTIISITEPIGSAFPPAYALDILAQPVDIENNEAIDIIIKQINLESNQIEFDSSTTTSDSLTQPHLPLGVASIGKPASQPGGKLPIGKVIKPKAPPKKRTIRAGQKPSIGQMLREAAKKERESMAPKKPRKAPVPRKKKETKTVLPVQPSEPHTSQAAICEILKPTEAERPVETAGSEPPIAAASVAETQPVHSIGKTIKPKPTPRRRKAAATGGGDGDGNGEPSGEKPAKVPRKAAPRVPKPRAPPKNPRKPRAPPKNPRKPRVTKNNKNPNQEAPMEPLTTNAQNTATFDAAPSSAETPKAMTPNALTPNALPSNAAPENELSALESLSPVKKCMPVDQTPVELLTPNRKTGPSKGKVEKNAIAKAKCSSIGKDMSNVMAPEKEGAHFPEVQPENEQKSKESEPKNSEKLVQPEKQKKIEKPVKSKKMDVSKQSGKPKISGQNAESSYSTSLEETIKRLKERSRQKSRSVPPCTSNRSLSSSSSSSCSSSSSRSSGGSSSSSSSGSSSESSSGSSGSSFDSSSDSSFSSTSKSSRSRSRCGSRKAKWTKARPKQSKLTPQNEAPSAEVNPPVTPRPQLGESHRLESPSPPQISYDKPITFEQHLRELGSATIAVVSPIPWHPFDNEPINVAVDHPESPLNYPSLCLSSSSSSDSESDNDQKSKDFDNNVNQVMKDLDNLFLKCSSSQETNDEKPEKPLVENPFEVLKAIEAEVNKPFISELPRPDVKTSESNVKSSQSETSEPNAKTPCRENTSPNVKPSSVENSSPNVRPIDSEIDEPDAKSSSSRINEPDTKVCGSKNGETSAKLGSLKTDDYFETVSDTESDFDQEPIAETISCLEKPNEPDLKTPSIDSCGKPCDFINSELDIMPSCSKISKPDEKPSASKISEPADKPFNLDLHTPIAKPLNAEVDGLVEKPSTSEMAQPHRKVGQPVISRPSVKPIPQMVAAAKAKAHQQLMNEMRNNEPKFKALQQYKIPKLADKVVSYARPTAFETAPKIGSEIPKPKYSRPNLPTRSNGSLLKSSMRPNLTFESAQAKRNYEYYQVQLRNFELQRGQSYHPDQATRLNAHYPVRSYVPPYSDSHLRSGYPREYLEQDYYPLRGVENYPRGYAMEDLYNMRERQLQGRPMYHPIRGAENYQRDYPYENIPPPRQGYYPRGYEAYQREYQNENVHLNAREQDADRIVSVAFAGRKYMTLQDLRERTKLSKDCLHKILKRIGKVKQPKWRISKSYLKAYEMESAGLAPPKDQESSVTLTEAICKVIKGFRGSQFQRIDTLVDRTGFREEKLKRVLKKIGKKRSTKWRLIAYKKPLIHLHRGHKGSSTALNTISNTIAHYN